MLRLTLDQIMAAPLDDQVFAEWYVDEMMPLAVPDKHDPLRRDELIDMTLGGLTVPRHFGVKRPDLAAQVLTIMWALGPSFYLVPAFRRVLEREDLDETAKVDALYAVDGNAAADAEEICDTRHWFPWLVEGNIFGLKDDPAEADLMNGGV